MSDALDQFVSLSSALTGVSTEQLKPQLDPIGIADQYLAQVDPATLTNLLTTFEQQSTEPGNAEQAAAFILADPTLGPVARSIIKVWLLGTWYAPTDPTDPTDPSKSGPPLRVVSSQAYKESLVWKVMQSHPMGYSMFSFGYWAEPPPAFNDFIQPANGGPSDGSN